MAVIMNAENYRAIIHVQKLMWVYYSTNKKTFTGAWATFSIHPCKITNKH